MIASPSHVSVLVPACNEQLLLPRCLDSVMNACMALPPAVTFDVVVVVDSSTDRTLEIAQRMLNGRGIVTTTNAQSVGRSRKIAAELALRRYSGSLRDCWLANTDADCLVPARWLLDQLEIASDDIEAIAGTIDVDSFHEHGLGVDLRFRTSYIVYPDGTHPHVHGANLGVRADAYVRAGGWGEFDTAEDHDLWNRLFKTGSRRRSISSMKVVTSGRRVGRAPKGFAAALSAHNVVPAC
jgi:glycosyltransferase involved in cell wall biosynthesis